MLLVFNRTIHNLLANLMLKLSSAQNVYYTRIFHWTNTSMLSYINWCIKFNEGRYYQFLKNIVSFTANIRVMSVIKYLFQQQYIFIHQCLLYVLESELGQTNTQSATSICSSNSNTNATFLASNSVHHANLPNGLQSTLNNPGNFVGNGSVIEHQVTSTWVTAPRIEVHQNPAFEDDEGIAESGLWLTFITLCLYLVIQRRKVRPFRSLFISSSLLSPIKRLTSQVDGWIRGEVNERLSAANYLRIWTSPAFDTTSLKCLVVLMFSHWNAKTRSLLSLVSAWPFNIYILGKLKCYASFRKRFWKRWVI